MLESLEARRQFSIVLADGVLNVTGSASADTLSASWDASSSTVSVSDGTSSRVFPLSDIDGVSIYGGDGGDTIYAALSITGFTSTSALLPVTINGGAGADSLLGSNSSETLVGGSSNDTLIGSGGDDRLSGEAGSDSLSGSAGDDELDAVYDGSAIDTLIGGTGRDRFHANKGSGSSLIDNVTDLVAGEVVEQYGSEVAVTVEALKTTATHTMTDGDFQSADFLSSDSTPLLDRGRGVVVNVRASPATIAAYPSKRFKYTFDFGDEATTSRFNVVDGFNAAHLYFADPNPRTITLSVRDVNGGTVYSDTLNVNIAAATYGSTFYVDGASGSDSNNGTSTSTPLLTYAAAISKVNALSGSSVSAQVLLKRGTTVAVGPNLSRINKSNVYIGSVATYATSVGAPVARLAAPTTIASDTEIIAPNLDTKNVIVQNLYLDGSTSKRGKFFKPFGTNASILDCTYLNVFTLASVEPTSVGTLIMNVQSDFFDDYTRSTSAEYSVFGDVTAGGFGTGGDQKSAMLSVFGNKFGLGGQHRIRTNTDFLNLSGNDLVQHAPSGSGSWNTARANSGDNVYWTNNSHRGGQAIVAQLLSQPSQPYAVPPSNVVIEGDRFYAEPVYNESVGTLARLQITSNAKNVSVRNNIIEVPNSRGIEVGSSASNVSLAHNTFSVVSLGRTVGATSFNGTRGIGIHLNGTGGAAARVDIVGNLFYAPNLAEDTTTFNSAGIKFEKAGAGDFDAIALAKQNVWPASGIKLFWYKNASNVSTGINLTQWNSIAALTPGDFGSSSTLNTSTYIPTVSNGYDVVSFKQYGILDDKYDLPRGYGRWTAGAVATNLPPKVRSVEFLFEDFEGIAVTFSEPVDPNSLSSSDISVTQAGTTNTYSLTFDSYDASMRRAIYKSTGLPNGNYFATVLAGAVSDFTGLVNSSFLSDQFFVLAGDADRDRDVDFDDLVILSQNYGMTGMNYSQGNFDYSAGGAVDQDDLDILNANYGTTLPAY